MAGFYIFSHCQKLGNSSRSFHTLLISTLGQGILIQIEKFPINEWGELQFIVIEQRKQFTNQKIFPMQNMSSASFLCMLIFLMYE